MTTHQSFAPPDPTWSNWGISHKLKNFMAPNNASKWHYILTCMMQTTKIYCANNIHQLWVHYWFSAMIIASKKIALKFIWIQNINRDKKNPKKSFIIRTPPPKKTNKLYNHKKSWSWLWAIFLFISSIWNSKLKILAAKGLLKNNLLTLSSWGTIIPKSWDGELFYRISYNHTSKMFLANLDEILANRSRNQPQPERKTARWFNIRKGKKLRGAFNKFSDFFCMGI